MDPIERLYVDYVYEVFEDPESIMNVPPGLVVLRNRRGLNLFEHPHVKLWHEFLHRALHHSATKPCALILPCSRTKPYRASAVHRQVDKWLKEAGLAERVQVYALSEPMLLVPRQLDIYYPPANYDYPKEELTEYYRGLFVGLLANLLPALRGFNKVVAALPKHHRAVLEASLRECRGCLEVEVLGYTSKAFRALKEVVLMLTHYCGPPSPPAALPPISSG